MSSLKIAGWKIDYFFQHICPAQKCRKNRFWPTTHSDSYDSCKFPSFKNRNDKKLFLFSFNFNKRDVFSYFSTWIDEWKVICIHIQINNYFFKLLQRTKKTTELITKLCRIIMQHISLTFDFFPCRLIRNYTFIHFSDKFLPACLFRTVNFSF